MLRLARLSVGYGGNGLGRVDYCSLFSVWSSRINNHRTTLNAFTSILAARLYGLRARLIAHTHAHGHAPDSRLR